MAIPRHGLVLCCHGWDLLTGAMYPAGTLSSCPGSLAPQRKGNTRARANPPVAALPWGWHWGGGKPLVYGGALSQGTRVGAEPGMGDKGLGGGCRGLGYKQCSLVSVTGVRFPGVGVLPGVPTGAGVKPKGPGKFPRSPGDTGVEGGCRAGSSSAFILILPGLAPAHHLGRSPTGHMGK